MHLCDYLEGTNSKITMFAHFQEYHRNHEKKKSLFGGRCHKNTDVCMDI